MSYKNPPKFHSETGASWTAFKKEASIWAKLTELKPEQQGLALFLTSLEGTVRDTVRDSISEDDMAKADGFKKIIDYVDGLFKKEKSRESYEAFKDFIYYKRSDNGSMDTYLMEFTRRYTKAKAQDMVVSDAILAFAVLEGANLTEDQKGICLATCSELKYEKMKTQIQNVVAPKPVKKQNIHPEVQAEVQFYAEEYPSEYYEQNIDSSAYEESGNSAATFDSHDVAANTCTGNNDVQTDANEVYYTNNANRRAVVPTISLVGISKGDSYREMGSHNVSLRHVNNSLTHLTQMMSLVAHRLVLSADRFFTGSTSAHMLHFMLKMRTFVHVVQDALLDVDQ